MRTCVHTFPLHVHLRIDNNKKHDIGNTKKAVILIELEMRNRKKWVENRIHHIDTQDTSTIEAFQSIRPRAIFRVHRLRFRYSFPAVSVTSVGVPTTRNIDRR